MKCDNCYFAGVFDSDGTLTIAKNKNTQNGTRTRTGYSYTPTASLTWLDNERTREVFADLLKNYAGGVVAVNNNGYSNRRPTIKWRTNGQNAARLATNILPSLHLEKRQAELVIQLAKIQRGNHSPGRRGIDNWPVQDRIHAEMMTLKMKGRGKK